MTFLAPALRDLGEAMQRYPLWVALGTMEVKQRYKRSVLGPFWITINIGIMIFGIGYIYANVFHSLHSSYIPYLATGIIAWNFINSSLSEGTAAFIQAGPIIKNVTISKLVHILHCLWRNILIFLHNIIIMVPVYAIYGGFPGWGFLAVIPGTLLLILFLLAASLLLAVISARYRDIPPAIAGLLQLAFFATPIIWETKSLSAYRWVIEFNPFFHLVECVRAPLLEGNVPLLSFAVTACFAIIMGIIALVAYAGAHRRIVFWL